MQIDQNNYGTMLFMSKQVSLPKTSSILQTMSMQNFGGVKEVHYGIVQVVNGTIYVTESNDQPCQRPFLNQ